MELKDIAQAFLQMVVNGQVEQAYQAYVAGHFRHHNPWFKGDATTLRQGMADNARTHPGKTLEVKNMLQDGDSVCVHSRIALGPGLPVIAAVHIFRFEQGLIAELWDINQPVPDNPVNENGMF